MKKMLDSQATSTIPCKDGIVHTPAHPFCSDMACPCHESQKLIVEVNQLVIDGLLTPEEAMRLFQGRQL